jgi:hypothetical protein
MGETHELVRSRFVPQAHKANNIDSICTCQFMAYNTTSWAVGACKINASSEAMPERVQASSCLKALCQVAVH